jgi:copper homeostasis protein
MRVLIEVCCGSVDDALQAQDGGADRVELNSSLFFGGLTPSIGALIQAKRLLHVPVMVMIRPRGGGFCYSETELSIMERDIEQAVAHGADGVVFGVLKADGSLDAGACGRLLDRAGRVPVVFHRAFDVMKDPEKGLEDLIGLGFARILTTGRRAQVEDGADYIKNLIRTTRDRIEILPGGMSPRNAARLIRHIGCNQVHIASFLRRADSSARGNPEVYFGSALYPPEDSYEITDRSFVAGVREAARGAQSD